MLTTARVCAGGSRSGRSTSASPTCRCVRPAEWCGAGRRGARRRASQCMGVAAASTMSCAAPSGCRAKRQALEAGPRGRQGAPASCSGAARGCRAHSVGWTAVTADVQTRGWRRCGVGVGGVPGGRGTMRRCAAPGFAASPCSATSQAVAASREPRRAALPATPVPAPLRPLPGGRARGASRRSPRRPLPHAELGARKTRTRTARRDGVLGSVPCGLGLPGPSPGRAGTAGTGRAEPRASMALKTAPPQTCNSFFLIGPQTATATVGERPVLGSVV